MHNARLATGMNLFDLNDFHYCYNHLLALEDATVFMQHCLFLCSTLQVYSYMIVVKTVDNFIFAGAFSPNCWQLFTLELAPFSLLNTYFLDHIGQLIQTGYCGFEWVFFQRFFYVFNVDTYYTRLYMQ